MLPVAQWQITQTDDGYFRRVNHADKMLTTGFGTEAALLRNTDILRDNEHTRMLMAKRYAETFGPGADHGTQGEPHPFRA